MSQTLKNDISEFRVSVRGCKYFLSKQKLFKYIIGGGFLKCVFISVIQQITENVSPVICYSI